MSREIRSLLSFATIVLIAVVAPASSLSGATPSTAPLQVFHQEIFTTVGGNFWLCISGCGNLLSDASLSLTETTSPDGQSVDWVWVRAFTAKSVTLFTKSVSLEYGSPNQTTKLTAAEVRFGDAVLVTSVLPYFSPRSQWP